MKYILLLAIILLITSCETKTYELEISYQDGKSETVDITSYGYPSLNDGCVYFHENDGEAVRCGVKSFTYKDITKHVE